MGKERVSPWASVRMASPEQRVIGCRCHLIHHIITAIWKRDYVCDHRWKLGLFSWCKTFTWSENISYSSKNPNLFYMDKECQNEELQWRESEQIYFQTKKSHKSIFLNPDFKSVLQMLAGTTLWCVSAFVCVLFFGIAALDLFFSPTLEIAHVCWKGNVYIWLSIWQLEKKRYLSNVGERSFPR